MFYSVPPVKALCGGHHVRESPTILLVVPLRRVLAINPDQWRRPSGRRLSRHSGISSEGTGPASIAATVAISAGASSSIGATMLGKVADGIVDVRVLLLRSSTTHRCQLALAMKFTCLRHGNFSSICAYAVQTQSITRRKDLPFAHWATHTHVHLVSCTNLTAHDSLHKSSGYIASHRRKTSNLQVHTVCHRLRFPSLFVLCPRDPQCILRFGEQACNRQQLTWRTATQELDLQ